jgi:VanZ family protein
MIKKTLNWLAVFVWMGIIFYFSSLPVIKSSSIDILDFFIKKSAHVTEYFILFFLLNHALDNKHPQKAFLFTLFYAFTDETHQLFTPGRGAKLTDVFYFDLTGNTLSFLLNKFGGPSRLKKYFNKKISKVLIRRIYRNKSH